MLANNSTTPRASWFAQWFDSPLYHKLYGNRDEKEAQLFIDALMREIGPAAGSTMLDLGCGNGRHSKYLAEKHYRVTGLDLSASSIFEAKRAEGPRLHFFRHDMRSPFGSNHYDYVFNFFTSFGYFTEEENHAVVNNISTCLKPGGTLVLDYLNSEFALSGIVPYEIKEIDGVTYEISRWTDNHCIYKRIQIHIGLEKPIEYIEQVRLYTADAFEQLFNKSGLTLQSLFGDYSLTKYNKHQSPRMVLVAKKRSR
jgi:SAM-dependent methyltransferase